MTDAIVHLSGADLPGAPLSGLVGRSLRRETIALNARLALYELPDNVLRDIGLVRDEIAFVPVALANAQRSAARRGLSRGLHALAVLALAVASTI